MIVQSANGLDILTDQHGRDVSTIQILLYGSKTHAVAAHSKENENKNVYFRSVNGLM